MNGTKLAANASKHAAVSYRRAGESIAQLRLNVQELVPRAEQAAACQASETLDMLVELQRREKRIASLRQARQIIEARAKEIAAAQAAEYQAKVAARAAQRDAGKTPRGPEPKAQYSFTDPESQIMNAGNGNHFEQAYTAQAVVDEAMLMVGLHVSAAPNDKKELAASVAAISPAVASDFQAVLTDSVFYSAAAVQAVEQKPDETTSSVSGYGAVEKQTHHKTVSQSLPQPEPAALPQHATPKKRMTHRLKTSARRKL